MLLLYTQSATCSTSHASGCLILQAEDACLLAACLKSQEMLGLVAAPETSSSCSSSAANGFLLPRAAAGGAERGLPQPAYATMSVCMWLEL